MSCIGFMKEIGEIKSNIYKIAAVTDRGQRLNKLNKILNKYPYLPFILGFSLLAILIIDLVNYYK